MIHLKDEVHFKKIVYRYYQENKRILPWREFINPYRILVSEIMLQQTQVKRVIPKYYLFIHEFPSLASLTKAPLEKVLTVWSGLGYNRRALYLQKAAKRIIENYHTSIPRNPELLMNLPGIGKNTAGSIIVFSYNIPCVFIETNIRRVFIHFFFKGKKEVSDTQILPLIEKL